MPPSPCLLVENVEYRAVSVKDFSYPINWVGRNGADEREPTPDVWSIGS
ncbi:hypothetical protein COO91_09833 (plasmid) [Nostoc flagelliforme CCNUN1]|uniref:Uncharacterized protein n=1 Tax=Nostoc flagelliforme CCNUN1 TaxID=2038116 RepID=A0A2K8T7N0_9NOSO|nr:hypothetical protein COO91_09833 [Nostoc flagelliforme CCNUN1]